MCFLVQPMLLMLLIVVAVGKLEALTLEGSSSSYAQFSKWYIDVNSSLELEFRTREQDGVLLYMDDGGYYDFMEIKLVSGQVRLRYNLGEGAETISLGRGLNNGHWHRVGIAMLGPRVTLAVDNLRKTVNTERSKDFQLGNFTINSFVYLGGLPPWYSSKLSSLALPSVVFEPRFRGEVRNVIYADSEDGTIRQQGMMAFKGVRQTSLDFCQYENPCKNKGVCISSDVGPVCECRNIDWEGQFCHIEKPPVSVTLTGRNYLGYDLAQIGGASQPIVAEKEHLHLEFRTSAMNGLLFYTGNGADMVVLYLKDGEIKLSLQLGSGQLKTGVSKVFFNDSAWHKVDITRRAEKVTLSVDDQYKERWTSPGTFNMLASSQVYVGGAPRDLQVRSHKKGAFIYQKMELPKNYVGCLRKVSFTADSIQMSILDMAREGNSLITSEGKLDFSCQNQLHMDTLAFQQDTTMENFYQRGAAGAISFTRPQAFLTLPTLEGQETGSLSVKIRTTEPNGVIFYNKGQNGHFFGMEMFSGHLYLHLDLGTGHVKIRVSQMRIDDGKWHNFHTERTKQYGKVTLDGQGNDFSLPGDADNLLLSHDLYLGGFPPNTGPHPPKMWSATMEMGFVGCVRDVVIDGSSVQLSDLALVQDLGSIVQGCQSQGSSCTKSPCQDGGHCVNGWNRYICDCSLTGNTGPTCARDAATLHFPGYRYMMVVADRQADIEADDITIRFRTLEPNGLLLAMRDDYSNERKKDFFEVTLNRGGLMLNIGMDGHETVMHIGSGLDDNRWHTMHLTRQGRLVVIKIDGRNQKTETLSSSTPILRRTKYHLAGFKPRSDDSSDYPNFSGSLQHVVINGQDFLEMEKNKILTKSENSVEFQKTVLKQTNDITFNSHHSYIGLPQLKAFYDLDIHFQFRTLEPSGLIMFNAGQKTDFLAIELVDGHIHLVFNLGKRTTELKDNYPSAVNNNQWHSVTITRPSTDRVTLSVDNFIAKTQTTGENDPLKLDGILFLGGARKGMFGHLPRGIISRVGYLGCLASLELAGQSIHPLEDAVVPSSEVSEGCQGVAFPQCTPETCANHGICRRIPDPLDPCDCDLTSFTGPKCVDESTSLEWLAKTGLVKYHFPPKSNPDTESDILSLGIITPQADAVVARVDSSSSNDYMELEIIGGNVVVVYNLGQQDIIARDLSSKINDGKYHVIRFTRNGVNATLQVDDNQINTVAPLGRQMSVFNSQSRLQIGGKWNQLLGRVEKPFMGVMAGMVFNKIRPLDLVRDRKSGTEMMGNVKIVDMIPYDYRERNLDMFEKMQRTQTSDVPSPGINDDIIVRLGQKCQTGRSVSAECFKYSGEGDELITPVYIAPTLPPYKERKEKWPVSCEDDEDCPDSESSGDHSWETTIAPKSSSTTNIPRKYFTSTMYHYRTHSPILEDDEDTYTPAGPGHPTYQPIPKVPRTPSGKSYENYDPKYNLYEDPEDYETESETPTLRVNYASSTSSTILVIGIILVVIIAIILIIVIVLKMRTKDDVNYKVEESKSFQTEEPSSVTNGFHPKQTKNNNNKPVKEWYV